MLILHVLFKTNRFYLENCTCDDDSLAPLFCTKSGEHEVTPTLFTTDLSETWKISSVRVKIITKLEACKGLDTYHLQLHTYQRRPQGF